MARKSCYLAGSMGMPEEVVESQDAVAPAARIDSRSTVAAVVLLPRCKGPKICEEGSSFR